MTDKPRILTREDKIKNAAIAHEELREMCKEIADEDPFGLVREVLEGYLEDIELLIKD